MTNTEEFYRELNAEQGIQSMYDMTSQKPCKSAAFVSKGKSHIDEGAILVAPSQKPSQSNDR